MQQRTPFKAPSRRQSRRPAGELEMHFSLPCCQLFATMALAME
jgi:hypothetical protein